MYRLAWIDDGGVLCHTQPMNYKSAWAARGRFSYAGYTAWIEEVPSA